MCVRWITAVMYVRTLDYRRHVRTLEYRRHVIYGRSICKRWCQRPFVVEILVGRLWLGQA